MKKFLFIFSVLMAFTAVPAMAKTAPVQTLQDYSFQNPPQTLNIKILANTQLGPDVMLYEGYTVFGKIVNASQNGFVFVPLKYANIHNDIYECDGNTYATFAGMLDSKKMPPKGILQKNTKFVLDFVTKQPQELPVNSQKYQTPEGGIAPTVNKEAPILLDDRIPKTSKDFPGIKLNSFDNGSNFNLEEPTIYVPIKDNNINNLKVD